MLDNKIEICRALVPVLQLTRSAYDLIDLVYDPNTEIVTMFFENGKKKVNVACDSGSAMIRDIMRAID